MAANMQAELTHEVQGKNWLPLNALLPDAAERAKRCLDEQLTQVRTRHVIAPRHSMAVDAAHIVDNCQLRRSLCLHRLMRPTSWHPSRCTYVAHIPMWHSPYVSHSPSTLFI